MRRSREKISFLEHEVWRLDQQNKFLAEQNRLLAGEDLSDHRRVCVEMDTNVAMELTRPGWLMMLKQADVEEPIAVVVSRNYRRSRPHVLEIQTERLQPYLEHRTAGGS